MAVVQFIAPLHEEADVLQEAYSVMLAYCVM